MSRWVDGFLSVGEEPFTAEKAPIFLVQVTLPVPVCSLPCKKRSAWVVFEFGPAVSRSSVLSHCEHITYEVRLPARQRGPRAPRRDGVRKQSKPTACALLVCCRKALVMTLNTTCIRT